MTSPDWKQVTADEFLKWEKENPMKETKVNIAGSLDVSHRWNPDNWFEFYCGAWFDDDEPVQEDCTYFIPEVTP